MGKKIKIIFLVSGITNLFVIFLCELLFSLGDPSLENFYIREELVFPCIHILYYAGFIYLFICFALLFLPNKVESVMNWTILVMSILHLAGFSLVLSLFQIFQQEFVLCLILILPLMVLDLVLIWLTLRAVKKSDLRKVKQSL